MARFKNVDLARRYHISEATVRNWVKMTQAGRLSLTLESQGGRQLVADTPGNIEIIEKLVEENRKYRNAKFARTISPSPEFYKVFSRTEVYDIIRNLELYKEIPRQYNYFDAGAHKWDEYVRGLAADDRPNWLNRTISLLSDNRQYLESRLAKYAKVNVVDVSVGNALPERELLASLVGRGILGRYIAIDISQEMLEIAEANIKEWFGDHVEFEGYQMDVAFARFANILRDDYLNTDAAGSVNLVLFLGGTATNLRNPDDAFRTICGSMNPNDLLVCNAKLETGDIRPQWLRHSVKSGRLELAPIHRVAFDLLNIDDSLYEVETGLNAATKVMYVHAKLKVALTLNFKFEGGMRHVRFEKGDKILLWRRWWQTSSAEVTRQLERNGFYVVHSSQSEDHEYLLVVAEPDRRGP